MEYIIRENRISSKMEKKDLLMNVQLFEQLRGECLKLYVFHPDYLSDDTKTIMFDTIQVALQCDEIRVVYAIELEKKDYQFPYLSLTSRKDPHLTVYLIPNGAELSMKEQAGEDELLGISRSSSRASEIPLKYRESRHAACSAFCQNIQCATYQPFEIPKHEGLEKLARTFASQLATDRYRASLRQLDTYLFEVQRGKISPVQLIQSIEIIRRSVTETYERLVPEEKRELSYVGLTHSSQMMKQIREWLEVYRTYILQDMEVNQKLQKAVDYIGEHYTEALNMAIVSNYVSMNYTVFSSEFKKYTGVNFVDYLKNIRIQEAKRLLAQTNLKIANVSIRSGFRDEKHFMKVFRTETGVSPTEYRKSLDYTIEDEGVKYV